MRKPVTKTNVRNLVKLTFVSLSFFISFLSTSLANPVCPKNDDHSLSAIRYQLFTAYQTGYDGYRTPCDLKCFSKENCMNKCQTEKGLASLALEFDKLRAKKKLTNCTSYTLVCLEQCQQHGKACNKACGGTEPVATN